MAEQDRGDTLPGIVAGLATYAMLRRLVIRWAAKPVLERELGARAQKE